MKILNVNAKLSALLLCLLLLPTAFAVSISPALVRIARPAPQEFQFTVGGANNIDVYLSGDLAQYAQVRDAQPGGPPRTVIVAFSPPSQLEPGRHELVVGARESSGGGGTVGARAAIEAPVILEVPYQGSHGEIEVKTSLADAGDLVQISVSVKNKGVAQLSGALTVEVLNGKAIALPSQQVQASPVSEKSAMFVWDSNGAQPGSYTAKAVLEYEGKRAVNEAVFTLGKPGVLLVKKPTLLEAGAKNRAVFELKSTSAKEQVVQVVFSVGGREKTATVKVSPFGDSKLELDFDALGLNIGTLAASLKLSTGSFSKIEEWSVELAARTSPAAASPTRLVLGIVLLAFALLLILWSRRR
ncbi:hypothetical protein HY642_07285 [Candidatus Woesearchaeota archaeon]|nr:hypothetical protein [Candidatus Woesearchaeota archaeon]